MTESQKPDDGRPLMVVPPTLAPAVQNAVGSAAVVVENEQLQTESAACRALLERVSDALEYTLPMARGYAYAHPVGANQDKIKGAEEALEALEAHRRSPQMAEKCPALKAEAESYHEALWACREFIAAEYGLDPNEAAHDGHPISKTARKLWDQIHEAMAPGWARGRR